MKRHRNSSAGRRRALVASRQRPRKSPSPRSEPLQLPRDIFFGAVAGVATNSKGHVFVYSRTGTPVSTLGGARPFVRGGSVLYQFDRNGKYRPLRSARISMAPGRRRGAGGPRRQYLGRRHL